jgi:hypothetical protein
MEENNQVLDELRKIHSEITELKGVVKALDDRLSSHINFIGDTYSVLKTPLDFIKFKIDRYLGVPSEPLEELK